MVAERLFRCVRTDLVHQLVNCDSTYAHHMKDARFTIPTPALLAKEVDLLDHQPMEERDTKNDDFEQMLVKVSWPRSPPCSRATPTPPPPIPRSASPR